MKCPFLSVPRASLLLEDNYPKIPNSVRTIRGQKYFCPAHFLFDVRLLFFNYFFLVSCNFKILNFKIKIRHRIQCAHYLLFQGTLYTVLQCCCCCPAVLVSWSLVNSRKIDTGSQDTTTQPRHEANVITRTETCRRCSMQSRGGFSSIVDQ